MLSRMATSTSSVARPHRTTTFSWRSESVISPYWYWSPTSATSFSMRSRIPPLASGVTMSFFEIETPACVA